jgi:hypothetical protein
MHVCLKKKPVTPIKMVTMTPTSVMGSCISTLGQLAVDQGNHQCAQRARVEPPSLGNAFASSNHFVAGVPIGLVREESCNEAQNQAPVVQRALMLSHPLGGGHGVRITLQFHPAIRVQDDPLEANTTKLARTPA